MDESGESFAIDAPGMTSGVMRSRQVHRLYTLDAPKMISFLVAAGARHEQAADWVHEIFSRALEKMPSSLDDNAALNWLWRVLLNERASSLRRKAEQTESLDQLTDADFNALADEDRGSDDIANDQLRDCVRRAFRAFAAEYPERAAPLVWSILEGHGTEEIAGRLNRTPGATREYLSQSRRKLESFLSVCRHLLP